jgi:hypothetical protein
MASIRGDMVRRTIDILTPLGYVLAATLTLFVAPTSAAAQSITVTITSPGGLNTTFGETLFVRANVTSVNQLSTVVASVGGISAGMTFSSGSWSTTLQTASLPRGAVTLTVTATDATAQTGQAQRALVHDNPPTLEYLDPEWNALASPDVRVRARCTDDSGTCRVQCLQCGLPAATGELDTVVSLAGFDGQQINLTIVASDDAQNLTQVWRPVWVEANARATSSPQPGLILDMADSRVLFIDEFPPRTLVIRELVLGVWQRTTIYTEGPRTIESGRLTPGGVLFTTRGPGLEQVHEWRNGALSTIDETNGDPIRVSGNWAAWTRQQNVVPVLLAVRRDQVTGASEALGLPSSSDSPDVVANGDAVFLSSTGFGANEVARDSSGTVTPVTSDPSTVKGPPRTDGTNVAFWTAPAGAALTGPYSLRLRTPSAFETLAQAPSWWSASLPAPPSPDLDYQVNNGWTAFTRVGPGAAVNVWTRAPDGTLRQVTFSGLRVTIEALGENGDVVFLTPRSAGDPGGRFLAPANGGAPIRVSSRLGRVLRTGGYWTVLAGPHAFGLGLGYPEATFTEGAASSFFEHDLAILNPTPAQAAYFVTVYGDDGVVNESFHNDVVLGPRSHHVVHRGGGGPSQSFSTVVMPVSGQPAVVERTMTWDASGYGGHSASPVDRPRMKWLFAEGAQGYFDTYFLLLHTGSVDATAKFTFFVEGGVPVQRTVTMPAHARLTVHAGAIPELVDRSFSTLVETSVPIFAERAMYFGPAWAGGHASAGVSDPATRWYHAEGATGAVFDTYILIANPNAQPANVDVTFVTDSGEAIGRSLAIPGFSRRTVSAEEVDPRLAASSFGVVVQSDLPIVSERSMYWSTTGGPWQEAHNSLGLTATATRWGTADGRAGGARAYQTYVLVANPSPTDTANLTVTFARAGGLLTTRTHSVGPGRRLSIDCNDIPELADTTFGVIVESTNGVGIVVERATYWNAGGVTWAGGTNVTATRLP